MRAYYDRRAAEYDDWWTGEGLFAGRVRPGWRAEADELVELVRRLPPARVLDVACGTGYLTRHLRGPVTAVDQSADMAAIAAARMPHAQVVVAEAVPLPFADGAFDRVFTSHFYGHLLKGERESFVEEARRVAPELVVVDTARRPGAAAEVWQERVLDDESRHRVYKRFFAASELAEELGGRRVLFHGSWFVAVAA
jgi:demethylmenaquinone methyltransferase/2-methoxy-6-polyprenyl-1,4-benzoquinol methylase